jgi:arabinofuranosyltransferase
MTSHGPRVATAGPATQQPPTTARSSKIFEWRDLVAALLLLGLSGVVATTVRFSLSPFEDAAILMRYAQNLADGHGLVWNVGEAPVDGATDFLFTVVVAGLTALGAPVEVAARLISMASWLATISIVYVTARRVHRAPVVISFLASSAIAVSTASLYISAGFGAPFFGLWVSTTAALAFCLRNQPHRPVIAVLFGLSWLMLGLARPEGVLLGTFVALALIVDSTWSRARQLLRIPVLVMLVVGGTYFTWHWIYFGYPLPNPFYKKGGSTLHLDGLLASMRASAMFVTPFGLAWLAAAADRRYRETALFTAIPIVLFTMSWILLSSETNLAGRFQYPVAVLVAQSWPALVGARSARRFVEAARFTRSVTGNAARVVSLAALVMALALPAVFFYQRNSLDTASEDERSVVGALMAPFASRGYVVATTEPGLIPLKSGWRALDTWGLNDQQIAHRGHLSYADMDAAKPTVIFAHAPFSPGFPPVPDPILGEKWTDMNVILVHWTAENKYERVRTVGKAGGGTWSIWVRPGQLDSIQLAERLGCRTYEGSPDLLSDKDRGVSCK